MFQQTSAGLSKTTGKRSNTLGTNYRRNIKDKREYLICLTQYACYTTHGASTRNAGTTVKMKPKVTIN